ncbi:TetR/AcrR family transcriptional regulator [Thermoactinospora rubra]|uniref:TetR/AcrR family transcriptional regulator n=1 Tax=Thermoactinospora rubra TaxID=1088767 RepID=UPI000A11BDC0|nr:TetR/AcrR family transcriptional regulator [Thermoactinospora rubra]
MYGEPKRDRKTERRERTREEILDAAWEIARAEGLAGLTLRDVAQRVGMRAPSLYSYFASKHAIYDAMFAQGWRRLLEGYGEMPLTGHPLADLKSMTRYFLEFSTADPARFQLMNQRTIPGFEPSPESYALAVKCLDLARERLAALGLDDERTLDLLTAINAGLASQQIANDPGGDRWTRLADEAMEMFLAHVKNRRTSDE